MVATTHSSHPTPTPQPTPTSPATPPATPSTTPSASPLARLAAAISDIKLAHTVFALPFAMLAAVLALPESTTAVDAAILLALVIAAMFFARTWAMLVNRLADHRIDASNPRTAKRAIPDGRLTPRAGWAIAAAAAALFTLTAAAFLPLFNNPWPLTLALPVLAWIALYSYTKRFTALAHFFLGSALAVSPLCAALAVNPDIFAPTWTPTATTLTLIAGFVAFWVAGFDIAYALQDLDFDRNAKLHSIPAKLGTRRALNTSRAAHAIAAVLLAVAALTHPAFHVIFPAAAAAVAALLIYEHAVLTKRGTAGLPLAFFTLNGIISCLLAAAAITDHLI